MKNELEENRINLEVILQMVKDFPNDTDLGNKIRFYCRNLKKEEDKKSDLLRSDHIEQTQ